MLIRVKLANAIRFFIVLVLSETVLVIESRQHAESRNESTLNSKLLCVLAMLTKDGR
jgi:hypothetical protein